MNLTKLDNGMTLLHREVPSQMSRLYMSFSRGSANDVVELIPGATHLMEHMLFKAPSEEEVRFNEHIESLGSESNAFTSYDRLGIVVSGLDSHFSKAVQAVFDFTLNRNFGEEELKTEKEVVIQEIRNYISDNGLYYFTQVLPKAMLHDTPFEVPIYGDELSVRALSSEQLRKIYSRWFFDNQDIVLSYCGPQKEKNIVHLLSGIFENRPYRKAPKNTAITVRARPQTLHVEKDIAGQALVTTFYPLDSVSLEEEIMLELLSSYWTDGSSSFFFRELRQNRGLVYSVASEQQLFGPKNAFFITHTECSKENVDEVKDLLANRLPFEGARGLDDVAFSRIRTKYLLSLAREFEAYSGYAASSIEHLRLYGHSDKNASKLEVLHSKITLNNLRDFYHKLIEKQPFICSMA